LYVFYVCEVRALEWFNYLSVIKYYLSLIKYYLSVIINYLSVIIENSTGKTKTNPIGNGSESYRK